MAQAKTNAQRMLEKEKMCIRDRPILREQAADTLFYYFGKPRLS